MVKVKVESEELMKGRVNGEEVLMVRLLYILYLLVGVLCVSSNEPVHKCRLYCIVLYCASF